MENIYSNLYPNYPNNYRYNSNLIHSNSQPLLNINNHGKKSYLNLSGKEIISNSHLPYKYNGSSHNLNTININPYKKNNNNIAFKLKRDNLLAHKQLNDIKDDYNNMKLFLNDKMDQIEMQQRNQIENLKNFFEERDIRENQYKELKYKERQRQKLLNGIKEQVQKEVQHQREMDEIRFRKQVDEIEKRRADIMIERSKLFEEFQEYNKLHRDNINRRNKDKEDKIRQLKENILKYNNNIYNSQRYPIRYPRPIIIPPSIYVDMHPPNKNQQNELFKLFLLRDIMESDKKPPLSPPPPIRFIPPRPPRYPLYRPPRIPKYYPPPNNQVQQRIVPQTIQIPQPIIIQSPQVMPQQAPNIIVNPGSFEQSGKVASPKVSKKSEGHQVSENFILQNTKNNLSQKLSLKQTKTNSKREETKQNKKTKENKLKSSNKKSNDEEKKKNENEEEEGEENEDEEEEGEENEDEEEGEDEENEDEEDEEDEDEDEDISSSREFVIRLYDPDDKNFSQIIRPVKNQ